MANEGARQVACGALSRLLVPRMLAAGSLVSSATAFRVGAGCVELWLDRAPTLAGLAVRASVGGDDSGRAQAAFRDDLIAFAGDLAEVSFREMRRGVEQFEAFTRKDDPPGERPHRPYRVKP
jgi:hypothetical protein